MLNSMRTAGKYDLSMLSIPPLWNGKNACF